MPCLNEAETLGKCIKKAQRFLEKEEYKGEVLVADNGSTDGSQQIAKGNGARVVNIKNKGYGNALMGGINVSKYEYIVMGDADDSYDFTNLSGFIEKLDEGYDLVMGNRFKGGIKPGAMPPLHKYLGNPILSGLGKLFFHSPVNDFHSGLRAFRKSSIQKLNLKTPGMEFASEMVVKATIFGLKITEVPITLYADGRSRKPHLRSWRDGWRHLKFLLLFSPQWLFLYPGLLLTTIGILGLSLIFFNDIEIFGVVLSVNTMVYFSSFLILGLNTISLGLYTNIYGINEGLLPQSMFIKKFIGNNILEKGVLFGSIIALLGIFGSLYAILLWQRTGFGEISSTAVIRLVIGSTSLLLSGIQIFFTFFFIGVLQIKHHQ